MKRVASRLVVVLAAATLVTACDFLRPDPTVDGTWTGVASGGASFSLTLSESDDGDITGSGTVSGSGGTITVTVMGDHSSHPTVTLTLNAEGYESAHFNGEFDEDDDERIDGDLSDSGFTGETLTLRKQ